ncbi:unnamed protein product [Closterium sp. NIES-53]
MYALTVSAEGDCYLCVPPNPGIEVAALGASESALPGTALAEALHTFTLDSGASHCFFCDSTTLTPLLAPVAVRMADPSEDPVLARSTTVLPCPAVPSGSLSGLHLPSISTNLGRERYFLLVVDDYSRYTTVFPLRRKGEVPDVLIPWIRAVRLQLCERFREDLPILRLHSDRGGEFSDLLRDFCRGESIRQSFTLLASPQQNGVAEHHIGLVMEVARTSMIHAAAPHFLWPFVVRFTTPPRAVSCPLRTSPLTSRFPLTVSSPTALPLSPPPLFLAPGPPLVDLLHPPGPAPSGVSQVDPLPFAEPVEVTVDSGAARGGVARGAASGGAKHAGGEPGGAETESVEPRGADPEGAEHRA